MTKILACESRYDTSSSRFYDGKHDPRVCTTLSQRERLHAHRVKVEALRVAVVWIVIALYQILESIEAGRTPAKKFMDKLRKPRGAVVLAAKRQCRLSPDQSFGL